MRVGGNLRFLAVADLRFSSARVRVGPSRAKRKRKKTPVSLQSKRSLCVLFLKLDKNYFNMCLHAHHLVSFVPYP